MSTRGQAWSNSSSYIGSVRTSNLRPSDVFCRRARPFLWGFTLDPQWWSTRQKALLSYNQPDEPLEIIHFHHSLILPIVFCYLSATCDHQWEFQDPKMEVLYHIRPYKVPPILKWPLISRYILDHHCSEVNLVVCRPTSLAQLQHHGALEIVLPLLDPEAYSSQGPLSFWESNTFQLKRKM